VPETAAATTIATTLATTTATIITTTRTLTLFHFFGVAICFFYFAGNYKDIRLTQMHNKMSLDLRHKQR